MKQGGLLIFVSKMLINWTKLEKHCDGVTFKLLLTMHESMNSDL